ncbi:MAG: 50S ribosomal protein L29 [Elusimicrobiota bacterium]|jgi:large subunit ribosomal protein L29|nr:50S ribosomal protein L29 [Elusimicrobiota bacterium]
MKTKNWLEIKNLSNNELSAKIVEIQDKLFKIKFQNAVSPVKNPLEIRELRKDVARLKTILNEKEKLNKNGKEK